MGKRGAKPKIKVGDIYRNAKGLEYVVIQYTSAVDIRIRFIVSGHIVKTRAEYIRNSHIKDELSALSTKNIFGIGTIGDTTFVSKDGVRESYYMWYRLMKYIKTHGIAYQLSEEFSVYAKFAKWIESDPEFGELLIDYNTEFFSRDEIILKYKPSAKQTIKGLSFKLINNTNVIIGECLLEFCVLNKLTSAKDMSGILDVRDGVLKAYKGWKRFILKWGE